MSAAPVLMVVKLQAQPGASDQVTGVMQELATASRQERGCQRFEVLQQVTEPTRFITVERWGNEAAADAHMRSESVQQALARLNDLLTGPPQFVRYRSVETPA